MSKTVYDGRIDGEFTGFNDEVLFKMQNGTYWIQSHYNYWYYYAYRPEATITEETGVYTLAVAGNSIPVSKLTDVIESRINGEFKGWKGESSYKLQNGHTWQQSAYKYEYKYAYSPEAIIYKTSGGYRMQVAGTTANVRRVN
jgi:hypothetical protein